MKIHFRHPHAPLCGTPQASLGKIDDRMFHDILTREPGIFPAYHMNKEHWITVLLDGTVEEEKIFELIDTSFQATAPKPSKKSSKEKK